MTPLKSAFGCGADFVIARARHQESDRLPDQSYRFNFEFSENPYLSKPDIRSYRFSVGYVGQKTDIARPFDCSCKLSLVFCTGTGDTPRKNFAAFGHITAQAVRVFVVDLRFVRILSICRESRSIGYSRSFDLLRGRPC